MRGQVITLGDILCGYLMHPETKSLGPDGEKCKPHTRGLLRRIAVQGGLQNCIGKEVSGFEQGKDDGEEDEAFDTDKGSNQFAPRVWYLSPDNPTTRGCYFHFSRLHGVVEKVSGARLLVPQSDHWIYASGPSRGEKRSKQRDNNQADGCSHK